MYYESSVSLIKQLESPESSIESISSRSDSFQSRSSEEEPVYVVANRAVEEIKRSGANEGGYNERPSIKQRQGLCGERFVIGPEEDELMSQKSSDKPMRQRLKDMEDRSASGDESNSSSFSDTPATPKVEAVNSGEQPQLTMLMQDLPPAPGLEEEKKSPDVSESRIIIPGVEFTIEMLGGQKSRRGRRGAQHRRR